MFTLSINEQTLQTVLISNLFFVSSLEFISFIDFKIPVSIIYLLDFKLVPSYKYMFLFSLLIFCSFLVLFETGSHFIALALLELAMQSWMASKGGLPASDPSASTMHHHTQLCLFSRALFIYFLESHAQWCLDSSLPGPGLLRRSTLQETWGHCRTTKKLSSVLTITHDQDARPFSVCMHSLIQ